MTVHKSLTLSYSDIAMGNIEFYRWFSIHKTSIYRWFLYWKVNLFKTLGPGTQVANLGWWPEAGDWPRHMSTAFLADFFSGCSGTVMAPLTVFLGFIMMFIMICLVRRVINPFITVKGHNCGLCFASSFASSFRAPDGKVILWCRLVKMGQSSNSLSETLIDLTFSGWIIQFQSGFPFLDPPCPSVFVVFLQFNP